MTAKNRQIDLPPIPSLPPIQMPDASQFSASAHPSSRTNPQASRRHISSPHVSQDTFMTAQTSRDSPATPPAADEDYYGAPSPTFSQSSSLRKSISVDSFVKARQQGISQLTRTARGNTLSSNLAPPQEIRQRVHTQSASVSAESAASSSRVPLREREKPAVPPLPTPSRSRGTSVSTNADDREGPKFFDESDLERSEDLSRRTRKSKTMSRQLMPPPGELGLPSRLQSVNSSPSISASHPPAPIMPVRSSSLSHQLARQQQTMSVDTHIPSHRPQITIAVMGAAGCGKSTVIQKGLKVYGLSEPVVATIAPDMSDNDDRPVTCLERTGRLSFTSNSQEYVLRVIEVDTSRLDLNNTGCEDWEKPSLKGVVVCYDSSREDTFRHTVTGLREFAQLKIPVIVLACKSEMEKRIDPAYATRVLEEFDVGLVEVSVVNSVGKERIRGAFEWLLRAIYHELQAEIPGSARSERDGYRNPASPSVLGALTASEISRASSATPTAASVGATHLVASYPQTQPYLSQSMTQTETPPQSQPPSHMGTPLPSHAFRLPSPSGPPPSRTPTTPTSPSRARSTSDLLSEHEKSKREEREQYSAGRIVAHGSPNVRNRGSLNALSTVGGSGEGGNTADDSHDASRDVSVKESRAPPWMVLDELLDKLLFMAVSDDDPLFVSHFLLTYRRFASPRSVLLAMQKRMRALDQPTGDPMFACYAQLRICLLLDRWITTYPTDFAVSGAAGALRALIKFTLTKTYLLHYGAVFLPFLESTPTLQDRDASWALKVEEDSDESSLLSEEAEPAVAGSDSKSLPELPTRVARRHGSQAVPSQTVAARDRKSSLPLAVTAKALGLGSSTPSTSNHEGASDTPKQLLKKLQSMSDEVLKADFTQIAESITRVEARYFLAIEPRHWLQHVLTPGKKDPEKDPIAKYNQISNRLADWVVSLILCHDKPKKRATQIEKFVQVAEVLRVQHNYSALRAFVAGINSATFEGDISLEVFQARTPDQWKKFQSYDHLLQSVRSHQKYRMALRNSKGACIPALEIHLSDLIRADEGNPDYQDDDPTKIHWAKFNMMARFVDVITQCQEGCRASEQFRDVEKLKTQEPWYLRFESDAVLMGIEMQRSRIAPPDADGYDEFGQPHQSKDAAVIRKIFFW
ncbi:ras guanine nucleotide exchange factor domain-containing protein [Fomitopsis serialis]|uniref:ras guanine nucleotide exchange factor domain-containing protein n=1 Tax=Fomitopsis serialis TaxID=139415 RepID=UPI002007757D|nr:ras guanine nucleotide exchange factor domain-containing protein [Neoantrodia serialis]KAH9937673.1 ras guanine nucleotide exchange factor domain-containing protein [Neoantrodia serialis]